MAVRTVGACRIRTVAASPTRNQARSNRSRSIVPAAARTLPWPRRGRMSAIGSGSTNTSATERSGTAELTGVSVRMAKRVKQMPQDRGFVLFDVVFEDGTRASNRRVPIEILSGLDGDEPARVYRAAGGRDRGEG